ncbi:hypothetical protein P3T27_008205 [Kitasatospora sp. MAA19]|uniref:hypothetical protein n=1 Tax=Kitasatospora sp. MAA19 TaxID=3035090 RepID=UPI002472E9D6|nr:hypothetical protein [Kitasatospora sp. MAA19]MDH6711447.1 hypothetical protein [Kitasatospora sp. MAA19]
MAVSDKSSTPGPRDARHPRRAAALAVRVVVQGLLVLAGLSMVGLGFSWFVDTYHEGRAYRTAPTCGTPAVRPGADCVQQESGRVTRREVQQDSDSTTYVLTVAREMAPTDTYDVGRAFYRDVETGTIVDLKVWRGLVVELGYHGHRAGNPHTPWLTLLKLGLLIGAGTAVIAYGAFGPDLDSRLVPVGMAALVAGATLVGAAILLSMPWPLAVVLTIAILAWLLAAAITLGISTA